MKSDDFELTARVARDVVNVYRLQPACQLILSCMCCAHQLCEFDLEGQTLKAGLQGALARCAEPGGAALTGRRRCC